MDPSTTTNTKGNLKQRILKHLGVFVFAGFISMPVIGILGSSNIVWGEPNQFGRIPIPGTSVLTLPAEELIGTVAIRLPGRGNETPDLPLPELELRVMPVQGDANPVITSDVRSTGNAMDNRDDTQRAVWKIMIPKAGDYRVEVEGDFTGIGINPELWIGHGPPLPGEYVPLLAAIVGLISTIAWGVVRPRTS